MNSLCSLFLTNNQSQLIGEISKLRMNLQTSQDSHQNQSQQAEKLTNLFQNLQSCL